MGVLITMVLGLAVSVQDSPNGAPAVAPRDLLEVAALEARRLRATYELEVQTVLRLLCAGNTHGNATAALQNRLAALGPDAAEVLLEVVSRPPQQATECEAYHATVVLRRFYQRDGDEVVLRELQQAAARSADSLCAVMAGLRGLEHPILAEMGRPLLAHADQKVVREATYLLAHQPGQEVTLGLRQLLTPGQEAEILVAVLQSLRERGDAASTEVVASLLAQLWDKAQYDGVTDQAIKFLGGFGDYSALAALRTVVNAPSTQVPRNLKLGALGAIQKIGLRHPERCRATAEELLHQALEGTPSSADKRRVARLLGPYHSETAHDFLVAPLRGRARNAENPVGAFLELAEIQLTFERWDEALRSARSAEKEDDRKAYEEEVAVYKAAAYAGMEQFDRAERALRGFGKDPARLLESWPSFRTMAANSKYRSIFFPDEGADGSR